MNISRFFASTNREAMRQVRLALGPDALIISNQRVNGGVEILAADPTAVDRVSQQVGATSDARVADSAALLREFSDLRGAMESRMDALLWGNQLKQSATTAVMFQFLLGCGFSTALLRAMLRQLPAGLSMRAAHEWVRHELARNLPVLDSEDTLWKRGLTLALVGPTGVGKTTTVAKLAARAVKRHGPEGVALLTTDTYRIGAYEQLKIYGELLRVPVRVIRDADDLVRVLELIPDWVTVLIDNMGVSQRDAYVAEQAAMLGASRRNMTRLLVLNASSHGETLDEVARRYAREAGAPLNGCIISKIDEASSFGAGLDAAIRYRLPIHFVSTGQKVPEDLHYLDAGQLVERALGQGPERSGLYSPSQDDLAALLAASEARPSQASGQGQTSLDELLVTLLSGSGTISSSTSPASFKQACLAVEERLPVAEAWDIWRALRPNTSTAVRVSQHLDRMGRTLRLAGHARETTPVLAVHLGTAMGDSDAQRGTLHASLLFDASCQPLVSTFQQLARPEGWWSSDGQSGRQRPGPAHTLTRQAMALVEKRPDWSVLHLLGGQVRGLEEQLEAKQLPWMSGVSSVARFYHEGVLTTASALAHRLSHQPVDQGEVCLDQHGKRRGPWTLWAAAVPVCTVVRQRPGLSRRFVSVQMVRRSDGKIVRHWYVITGSSLADAPVADLARWSRCIFVGRTVLRSAARQFCAAYDSSSHDAMANALLAAQMALAAHAVVQDPGEFAEAFQALSGQAGVSDLTMASEALFKLFTLKQWLSDTEMPQ